MPLSPSSLLISCFLPLLSIMTSCVSSPTEASLPFLMRIALSLISISSSYSLSTSSASYPAAAVIGAISPRTETRAVEKAMSFCVGLFTKHLPFIIYFSNIQCILHDNNFPKCLLSTLFTFIRHIIRSVISGFTFTQSLYCQTTA